MRNGTALLLFLAAGSLAGVPQAAAQDVVPVPVGPTITITKGEYQWDPTKTLVTPHFEGTVANAQGYTFLELQKRVVVGGKDAWVRIGVKNLTVAGDGTGSWTIDGKMQVNATASYRVLMKMKGTDADDAATTKSAEMNLTALKK